MGIWEQFKSKNNQQMLWDVLLDEFHINTTTHPMLVTNIKTVFDADVTHFTDGNVMLKPHATVMMLNKDFLTHMITAVRKLLPNFVSLQNNRIIIGEDDLTPLSVSLSVPSSTSSSSVPYNVEDIHAKRQREFEKEVEQKRMELNAFLLPPKPTEIDFSDKIPTTNTTTTLPLPKFKKVSWDTLDNDTTHSSDGTLDIFNKLKQTKDNRPNYVEQQSSTLPQIKQEEIVRKQATSTNMIEPMLSSIQIVKQLNEMNSKIDNLTEMLNRILSYQQPM